MEKIISILIVFLMLCYTALPALATDGHYSYEIFTDSVLDTWVSENDKEIFAENENFDSYYASNKDKNSIVYYSYINGYVDFRILTFVLESFSYDTTYVTIQNKNRTLSSIIHRGYVDNSYGDISSLGTMSSDEGFIVVDSFELYEAFKSINSTCNVYFADNPIRSVYEYVNDIDSYYLCDKVDGYKSMLRYYDCFDSPAGVNDKVYQDEYENWVSASVSFKDDVYYSSTKIADSDTDNGFMHNEIYKFYITPNLETMQLLSENADDKRKCETIILDYLDKNTSVIHYADGHINFSDWYYDKVVPSLPFMNTSKSFSVICFNEVASSTDKKLTINTTETASDIYTIAFYMPDTYTYLDSEDGHSILNGYHTQHWYPELDLSDGSIIINSGFGGDISNADFAEHPSRETLLQQGWETGYPNNSGDYPYKITCNVNGEPYLYFYFSQMPNVASSYYSDSMFRYSVDFFNTEGYIYDPLADCSISFDFTNLTSKADEDFQTEDYWEIGGVLKVRDPLDAITDFLGSSSQKFSQYYLSTFLGIDYLYFSENFKMHLWTNYTGSITANKYKGYYVQLNWNLEEADNFIKDNSSDDYDYSQDYLPDDGFKDNNGNTHGGGIITDTSAGGSGSTDSTVTQFDFNETNLWEYANSFLKFSAAAFTVLPAWIWALLGTSMTILIVLRILGR